jgi:hypothetical protein
VKSLVLALLILAPLPALAQETRTASPGAAPPQARVEDLSWAVGNWEGEGIEGPAREIYFRPMGGQMAGHFTQTRGDGIWFYEIVTIVERSGSLVYRLRHFNADLTAWEERNVVREFPLVAREGNAFYFDGLTIRPDGPDHMVSAARIRGRDGAPSREVVFRYRRVR